MQAFRKLRTMSESGRILGIVTGILVFGSIRGLVQSDLDGALHFAHFPLLYKGAIPRGIGMTIMAAFVAMYRRTRLVLLLAFQQDT